MPRLLVIGTLAVLALLASATPGAARPRPNPSLTVEGKQLGVLAPLRLRVAGAKPRTLVRLLVRVDGGAPILLRERRASGAGRAGFTVSYGQLRPEIEARGLVGTATATFTVVAAGRRGRATAPVVALPPDPLVLAALPADAPIAVTDPLTLHLAGIRPAGPPLEIRYLDCADQEQVLAVPRTTAALDVVLPAAGPARAPIEATCFADLQAAGIDFTAGLVLAAGFSPVATARVWFLPPAGT